MVVRHPYLRGIAAYTGMFTFCGGSFAAFYTLYIINTLGLSFTTYGLLVMMGGIGNLVGVLLTRLLARRLTPGVVILAGACFFGLCSFGTPLARGHGWETTALLMGTQLIGDCALIMTLIQQMSWRQSVVPEHMQGRVNAFMHVLEAGVGPLGALVAAIFCQYTNDVRLTLLLGSCGLFLAPVCLFAVRIWHLKGPGQVGVVGAIGDTK